MEIRFREEWYGSRLSKDGSNGYEMEKGNRRGFLGWLVT